MPIDNGGKKTRIETDIETDLVTLTGTPDEQADAAAFCQRIFGSGESVDSGARPIAAP
jgi:hypothetical protein